MKWRVWITGYPGSVVEIEEGAMPLSAITAMAYAAIELKAHHHGEIIEMNAATDVLDRRCLKLHEVTTVHARDCSCGSSAVTHKFVRLHKGGRLEIV